MSLWYGIADVTVFVERCPDLTPGAFCAAGWSTLGDVCCGICPSPAINGSGTVIGLVIAAFCLTILQWFAPSEATATVAGQVLFANMYIVSVLLRFIFAVDGGIQRFHAQFAFLMAGSCVSPLSTIFFARLHELNGFKSDVDYQDFLRIYHHGTPEEKQNHSHWHRPGDGLFRRIYFAHRRHVALVTAAFFTLSLAMWITIYVVLATLSEERFWQSNCKELISESSLSGGLLVAFPVVLLSIALLITSTMWGMVALHHGQWRSMASSKRPRQSSSPGMSLLQRAFCMTKPAFALRYIVPVLVYATWAICIMLVWTGALRNFMLIAGSAFNFSAMQNLVLGFWGIFAIGFALRGWMPSIDKQRKHELQGFSRAELVAIAENIEVGHRGVQRKTLINDIVAEEHRNRVLLEQGHIPPPVSDERRASIRHSEDASHDPSGLHFSSRHERPASSEGVPLRSFWPGSSGRHPHEAASKEGLFSGPLWAHHDDDDEKTLDIAVSPSAEKNRIGFHGDGSRDSIRHQDFAYPQPSQFPLERRGTIISSPLGEDGHGHVHRHEHAAGHSSGSEEAAVAPVSTHATGVGHYPSYGANYTESPTAGNLRTRSNSRPAHERSPSVFGSAGRGGRRQGASPESRVQPAGPRDDLQE